MKFYFNMNDVINKKPENEMYWTKESIRQVRIYHANATLDNEWMNNPNTAIWPVYDACGFSTEAVECKDKDAAYDEMLCAFNSDIYAKEHDI